MSGKIRDSTRIQVIGLLLDPIHRLSQKAIAEITGVSTSYVAKLYSEIKPATKEISEILLQYQELYRVELPLEARAKVLSKIVKESTHDMTRLKAIQYIDELDGVVTDKQRRLTPEQEQPPSMFIFPPGSEPNLFFGCDVDLVNPDTPRRLDAQSSESEPIEVETIEVTDDEGEGKPESSQSSRSLGGRVGELVGQRVAGEEKEVKDPDGPPPPRKGRTIFDRP